MLLEDHIEGAEEVCSRCGYRRYLEVRDLAALVAEAEARAEVNRARMARVREGRRDREDRPAPEQGPGTPASLSGHGTANRALMCSCEPCAKALEHLRARRREAVQRFRARQAVPA